MSSTNSIEYTIGYMEVQYQIALSELKQCEVAAAAWKKVTADMNTQINYLIKQHVNNTYDTNAEDHVVVYISDE